jgi:hypothetical protein
MPSPDTDEFFGLVYAELRRLAAQHLRRERSNHTLQPTALVHEAYLELASSGGWKNRAHFFGVASLAIFASASGFDAERTKQPRRGDHPRTVELLRSDGQPFRFEVLSSSTLPPIRGTDHRLSWSVMPV